MTFRVDGGCRGNGYANAIGSAAVCVYPDISGVSRFYQWQTEDLPQWPNPTNHRAELSAVILALKLAIARLNERGPWLNVDIHTDSMYAVHCMTRWRYFWARNGWRNSQGQPVVHRDLIQFAAYCDDQLNMFGDVNYIWVPRNQNRDPDRHCNDAMDAQRRYW